MKYSILGEGKRRVKSIFSYRKEYDRAFNKSNRSDFWKRIVAKTPYEVEIIIDNLSQSASIEKEIEFIKLYGRAKNGGTLCNLTDGGEFFLGREFSKEERDNIALRCQKRRQGQPLSDEWKERIRASMVQARKNKFWKSGKAKKSAPELRLKNSRKISVLCLDSGIYYESITETAIALFSHKNLKVAINGISRVGQGSRNHYQGLKFQFV